MDQLTTEQVAWGIGIAGYQIACVVWAWYIAVQKNRWWYEGFWMGLTLGPFGVIAAACMPVGEPSKVVDTRSEYEFSTGERSPGSRKIMPN
jgi:hypothetical protein